MQKRLPFSVLSLIIVVVASNYLVTLRINDYLTWGAITYPISFLITDITNRLLGPRAARRAVYAGFVAACAVTAYLFEPRIALASGAAFFVGQLLDIFVFNWLRKLIWWLPPFLSSSLGSLIDTCIFFSLAFAGTDVPWVTLGIGDFGVKLALAVLFLAPFRAFFALLSKKREDAALAS